MKKGASMHKIPKLVTAAVAAAVVSVCTTGIGIAQATRAAHAPHAGATPAHASRLVLSDTVVSTGILHGSDFVSYWVSTTCSVTSHDDPAPFTCTHDGMGAPDPVTGVFTAYQFLDSSDGEVVWKNIVYSPSDSGALIKGTGVERDRAAPGSPPPKPNKVVIRGKFTTTPLPDGLFKIHFVVNIYEDATIAHRDL